MTDSERHPDAATVGRDDDRTPAGPPGQETSGSADQRSTDTFEGVRTDEDDVEGTPPSS